MSRILRFAVLVGGVGVSLIWFGLNSVHAAPVVLGNWESGTREGWIDWNFGVGNPVANLDGFNPAPNNTIPKYQFNSTGATLGTKALQFNLPAGGYTQWASFKLQLSGGLDENGVDTGNGIKEYRPDFMTNTKLAFDLTLVASEQGTDPSNNFAEVHPVINADGNIDGAGNGFVDQTVESATPFTGQNGANSNSFNPLALAGTQTTTMVFDIGHLHDGNAANGEVNINGAGYPNYVEIVMITYSNGPVVYHLDNVRLFTPVVAVQGDYNQDGVVNAADYTTWRDHLGQSFALPNRDTTNSGNINQQDYTFWKSRFGATTGAGALSAGAVPEPASWLLALVAACGLSAIRRRS